MESITGKITKIIYRNEENSYTVALFRVKESSIDTIVDTTIQLVGSFIEVKYDILMHVTGEYVNNPKYGKYQFNSVKSEYVLPSTEDKILEFLGSKFIEGCGKVTAKKLISMYGLETLDKIKDINNILSAGISIKSADKIHKSILNYDKTSDLVIKLETIGFTVDESTKIINRFKTGVEVILENDFYLLKEVIDFKKLDHLYTNMYDASSIDRVYHCLIETMNNVSFSEGHTYYDKEVVLKYLKHLFNITLSEDVVDEVLLKLVKEDEVVVIENKIFLKEYYDSELYIASALKEIDKKGKVVIDDFDEKIIAIENLINIEYDILQKKAVKSSLENNISIISGGPGTGKTTLLNALVKMYIEEKKLSPKEVMEEIALLAPTGRASKKMSMATGLPASTIHRYLKWKKESDSFVHDEFNKTAHKFIVVDESSMLDVKLFSSLLKALKPSCKLILVGDSFQLPSVGAGQVLNNLIESELFNYIPLSKIYRQSDNSYIPFLAQNIKNIELDEEFLNKKDDYNFINAQSNMIPKMIKEVIESAKKKDLTEENIQVLVPIYKGDNGIDNLNLILRDIYNPSDFSKKETSYGSILFRENDKILQLSNDPDNNIFNGDIGYIKNISPKSLVVNFEGTTVELDKKALKNIKHAYAISVHKSQGSEFDHVIMPITREYFMMMYNKLIYTGVSRAKKSLILLGDPMVFANGVRNNRADNRNTLLKETLSSIFMED